MPIKDKTILEYEQRSKNDTRELRSKSYKKEKIKFVAIPSQKMNYHAYKGYVQFIFKYFVCLNAVLVVLEWSTS